MDFGASDAPLKPDELDEAGLVQFPVVMGGVVPVINVSGLKSGDLKLSPDVLAGIFLGRSRSGTTRRSPFPMSVADNISFGVRLYERLSRADMEDRVQWALQKAALWDEVKDKLRQDGTALSGGRQQRLCIARSRRRAFRTSRRSCTWGG